MKSPPPTDETFDQSKEIDRLKKALELEKMRSAGYRRMIELSEKQVKTGQYCNLKKILASAEMQLTHSFTMS